MQFLRACMLSMSLRHVIPISLCRRVQCHFRLPALLVPPCVDPGPDKLAPRAVLGMTWRWSGPLSVTATNNFLMGTPAVTPWTANRHFLRTFAYMYCCMYSNTLQCRAVVYIFLETFALCVCLHVCIGACLVLCCHVMQWCVFLFSKHCLNCKLRWHTLLLRFCWHLVRMPCSYA